jgi:hypothetical protein
MASRGQSKPRFYGYLSVYLARSFSDNVASYSRGMAEESELRYYPFLKGKAGEFEALEQLRELEPEARPALTPLFDVPPEKVTFDLDDGRRWIQIETVDETLNGYAARVARAWPAVEECFVDLAGFDPDSRLRNGDHPVSRFFGEATESSAIPVTGLDRDRDQREAVKAVCQARRLGCAIRLRQSHLATPTALTAALSDLVDELGLRTGDVDLLLDFGELTESALPGTEKIALAAVAALPTIDAWRRLIFCSGAFPFELSGSVGAEETKELPRLDWKLWRRFVASRRSLRRLPSYGDYGPTNADWKSPFDWTQMSLSAKIVYATKQDWVVAKGRQLKSENGPQYQTLSRRVKGHKDFLGKGHCPSEARILERAVNADSPGNTKEWVTTATRHHIEVVSRQLANLF